jgi:multidrug resistance efflux pump
MSEKLDLEALKIQRPRRTYSSPPSSPGRLATWLLLGSVTTLLMVWFFPGLRGQDVPEVAVLPIESSRPKPGTIQGMAANGHVVAARRAALSADTPGRIVSLNVSEGSSVEKGQIVAQLYSEEYAAAVQRARAQEAVQRAYQAQSLQQVLTIEAELPGIKAHLAAAQQEALARQASASLADIEALRVEKLTTRGAGNQRELDRTLKKQDEAHARWNQALAQEEEARAALGQIQQRIRLARTQGAVLQARLKEAQATTALTEATLEKTRIRAPFAGIVVLKDAEVGEVVSPNVSGGPSSRGAIVTLIAPESLEIQAEVPETSLQHVRLGGKVKIFLDADSERPLSGHVSRIWPTANRQKATIEVRVRLDQIEPSLRPDMGVRVVFLPKKATSKEKAAIPPPSNLPRECLVHHLGKRGVFLARKGQAHFLEVPTSSHSPDGGVPATSLPEGALVLLSPPASLADGDSIRIRHVSSR